VVQDVAESKITLNITPAELALKAPPYTQVMRDSYEESFHRNKNLEQEIADWLRRAADGFGS
jgi:hypothetical protein